MREKLEEDHEIKTQANTPWITTVLRFIIPTDRQTAYNYSKVLQIAHDENLAAAELPAYIKERGGIAKITATKEDAEAAKRERALRAERLARLTEYIAIGMASVVLAALIIYGIILYMLHLR
jgi:hypothetical protein